jgi:hypothetical protein
MQHTHHSHFSSHILQIHTIHQSINQSSIINHQLTFNLPPNLTLLSQLNFDSSPFALALSQIQSQSLAHTPHPPHSLTLTLTLSSLPQKHSSPLLANLSPHSHSHHPHITPHTSPFVPLPPSPPSWPFLSTSLSLSFNTSLFSSTPLHPLLHSHTIPTIHPTHSLTHLALASFPPILCATMPLSPPVSVLSLSSNQALSSHPLTLTLQHNTSSLASLSVSNSPPPPHLLSSSSSSWPHSPCQIAPAFVATNLSSLFSLAPASFFALCPSNPTPVTPHTSHTSPHE